jgi:hypothetical protein
VEAEPREALGNNDLDSILRRKSKELEDAVANEVNSTAMREKIKCDVKKVGEIAADIERDFTIIAKNLKYLAQIGLLSNTRDEEISSQRLQNEWELLHKVFEQDVVP